MSRRSRGAIPCVVDEQIEAPEFLAGELDQGGAVPGRTDVTLEDFHPGLGLQRFENQNRGIATPAIRTYDPMSTRQLQGDAPPDPAAGARHDSTRSSVVVYRHDPRNSRAARSADARGRAGCKPSS
jgi:hypothetical protein